jgi:hypothetical protein
MAARKPKKDPTAWRDTPEGNAKYHAARAEAQARANATGMDHGIEANDLFKTFTVRTLPRKENRSGHELQVEVVMPEDIRKAQPGHGPLARNAAQERRTTPMSHEDEDHPIGLTYGEVPPFDEFIQDIRRPDPDYEDGRAYWPHDGSTYPMELVDGDEIDLAEQFGGLTSFATRYAHKAGFRADERTLYDFIAFLAEEWNNGNEGAGDLASSIMTTLGYEWI